MRSPFGFERNRVASKGTALGENDLSGRRDDGCTREGEDQRLGDGEQGPSWVLLKRVS